MAEVTPKASTTSTHEVTDELTPALDKTLRAAEQMLIYAAQNGIAVDDDVAQKIINATKHQVGTPWDGDEGAKLLSAIAVLAAKVRPVTADTLEWGRTIAPRQIRYYTAVAVALVLVIVPLSILSFVTTGISASISTDLQTANNLAVSLHTQLDTPLATQPHNGQSQKKSPAEPPPVVAAPPGTLGELQQFAATIRAVKDHTAQLSGFLWAAKPPTSLPTPSPSSAPGKKPDPYELKPELPNTLPALQQETNEKTALFQEVRRHAKDVQDTVSLFYGAIGTFVLPMFYALLGACAYLLRLFSKELSSGSFSNQYDIAARFFVALIGGLIVGLFNNFTITGASLSPLALAFLVGYAADVFFTFLENLLQGFKKSAA